LCEAVGKDTTERTGESTERKYHRRSLPTLGFLVYPPQVHVDAWDQTGFEQTNEESAGI
jgi:hypothetical protein